MSTKSTVRVSVPLKWFQLAANAFEKSKNLDCMNFIDDKGNYSVTFTKRYCFGRPNESPQIQIDHEWFDYDDSEDDLDYDTIEEGLSSKENHIKEEEENPHE